MSQGCDGGFTDEAWQWFTTKGVVTGGLYESVGDGKSCYPYPFMTCAWVHAAGTRTRGNVWSRVRATSPPPAPASRPGAPAATTSPTPRTPTALR